MQVILASRSPYRRSLLENFGISFQVENPLVNEAELKSQGPANLVELTRFLALKKAESLRGKFPKAIIIGSDQIAEVEGERLDKPGTFEKALEQLKRFQGKNHRLITSLAVISPLKSVTHTEITLIKLRQLSEGEIVSYLKQDEPYDCAGAIKIEKAGLALIESMECSDPSAIKGLPLIALTKALKELGLHLPQIWSRS